MLCRHNKRITDNLNIGIGRSSYTKIYDSHIKYRFLRQRYGANPFPFTATAMASAMIRSDLRPFGNIDVPVSSRMYYTYQLMIARKFGDWDVFSIVDSRNIERLNKGDAIEIIDSKYNDKVLEVKLLSGFSKGKNFFLITEDLERFYKLSEEESYE
mgnify:CR=1 FL=1